MEAMYLAQAYIVDAVRTPVGRRGGTLSAVHPADLGGHVMRALVDRNHLDPTRVDDVIFGCVDQIGAQGFNVARTAWLAAGLPESVPATTIDRQCGSAQQAVHFAAQGVMAGSYDLCIAGGVEVMSMVPIGSSASAGGDAGFGLPFEARGMRERYGETEISQYRGAQMVAERWDISRQELERYALASHRRADAAWSEGRFAREVVVYDGLARDECIRPGTSLEKMATLPSLAGYTLITAAVSSQVSDGAAALLVASEKAVREHKLVPRARVRGLAVVGSDPIIMLTGPIAATQRVLERTGVAMDDVDLFEINEAFASVVLAWSRETGASLERTNVNGGAIAMGHPLRATGAKLMATLLCELERTGGRIGLQTMCEGGGMANATLLELV
jgi:acetyl-CoA C-acetyltransferase